MHERAAIYRKWLDEPIHTLEDGIGGVTLLDFMGNDLMVANSARVSMSKWKSNYDGSDKKGSDKRIIQHMASSKPVTHFSPFAHPQIQFRIVVPIFVARQWTRSNIGTTRNEVSRRYVDAPPEFYLPHPDLWRRRPEASIKQGSGGYMSLGPMSKLALRFYMSLAMRLYKWLLKKGVAPEMARIVLPQNMYTTWIETGSLYFWANFVRQRIDEHAQWEIRQYAQAIDKIMKDLFPDSWEALGERE